MEIQPTVDLAFATSGKIRLSNIIDDLIKLKEEKGDMPVGILHKTSIVNEPVWAKSVYTVTICNDNGESYVLMDIL